MAKEVNKGEKKVKKVNNEEIKKREEELNKREKKLAEKGTELEKEKAVLDEKEKFLDAAKVVKGITGRVEGIRYWVIIALIISAVSVAIGEGLWFHRIPAMENRIADKIAVLGQKIATLSVEKVSQYRFEAVSQKTKDRKNFGFDVEKMEGKVFTTGVPGSKNLYIEAGDTVKIALTDARSGLVLEKTFEKVQPGDVIEFKVK